MPKADVVCSVIAAVDFNYFWCSDLDPTGLGFHLTKGLLLLIPIDATFVSVRVTMTQTQFTC